MVRGTSTQFTEMRPGPGPLRWIRCDYDAPTPLPEAIWAQPDFDDSGWGRRAGPILGVLGHVRGDMASLSDAALLCVRAKFGIADPDKARGAVLKLAYRGGTVVYLNGIEIARGHLPQGKIGPLTLAEDYPPEMFRRTSTDDLPRSGADAEYLKRVRELSVELPPERLTKGPNVLAIELHRTAVPDDKQGGKNAWATVGMVSLAVMVPQECGVRPAGPASGVHVWNADALTRPGIDEAYGDPLEPLRPITMIGPRRAILSGQVVVSSPEDCKGFEAAMSDLKSAGGAMIPATACRIRYVRADEAIPMLMDKPSASAKLHPIWLTVSVHADAAPGAYRGTLSIAGESVVPVELSVIDWTLPHPADWVTAANLLQSPEAVAGHYQVPLWSEEHFKCLEKSLALMGYVGNNGLGIGALAKDVLGNDPAVVFSRDGERWKPDLRFAERYLSLYARHAAPPRVLSLQVWNYSISGTGARRDSRGGKRFSDTLPFLELRDGKLNPGEMPGYGKPGSEETWREVLGGLRGVLDKLGWQKTELVLGTSGDDWPVEEIVAFFKGISPKTRWRVATHGSSVGRWGASDAERTQANGMVVGWANMVRRNASRRVLPAEATMAVIVRDGVSSAVLDYYSLPALCRQANFHGFCFRPFDYWTFPTPQGARCPLAMDVTFGNITPHGPRAFVVPGPQGAVATPQLEMLREGMQLEGKGEGKGVRTIWL
jgi:hypothetical protein